VSSSGPGPDLDSVGNSGGGGGITLLRVAALALIPIGIVVVVFLLLSINTVPAGHVGVERGFGGDVTGTVYEPGTHLVMPWKSVQEVECRQRTYTMSDSEGEGDRTRADAVVVDSVNGTSHRVDVSIRYSIDPEQADRFVKRWNDPEQMEERLIRPDVRSDLRDEGASISTLDIFRSEGRERLSQTTERTVSENFADEPVTVEAVKVREVTVPEDVRRSLEQRQQAKVEIQTRENEIEVERREAERKRVEAEADADVKKINAEADAEVIRIRSEALRENPIILQERLLEAYDRGTVFVLPRNGTGTTMLITPPNEEGQARVNADGIGAGGTTGNATAPDDEGNVSSGR